MRSGACHATCLHGDGLVVDLNLFCQEIRPDLRGDVSKERPVVQFGRKRQFHHAGNPGMRPCGCQDLTVALYSLLNFFWTNLLGVQAGR